MNCDNLHIPGLPDTATQKACIQTNLGLGLDAQGNKIAGAPANSSGGSFFGIPIPGSDWQRHIMFRIGEVIVGIAMVVVGIKAFTNSGPTIKLITQTGSKIAKKVN